MDFDPFAARDRGRMPFLLGLILTPVGAGAGTLALMLIDAQGLSIHPMALLIGTVVGVIMAPPVTLLILPLACYAIEATPYDRQSVHVGVGLLSGTIVMLWMGWHTSSGVTKETLELTLAGAVGGTVCGALQGWAFRRRRVPPDKAAAGSPARPAHS
jgi:hypothetical protein